MKLSSESVRSKSRIIPRIRFECQALTSFAGLATSLAFFQTAKITDRIYQCFRRTKRVGAFGETALHTLGTYGYHFWMMDMDPIRRRSGNQHLHRKSKLCRQTVRGRMDAYRRYVQLGCIAQGILQFLAVTRRTLVWNHFGSWLRTMKTDQSPSEMVVIHALRETLPHVLVASHGTHDHAEFIVENADLDRLPRLTLAG